MTKVLVIDDEELIRDRMQQLLELDDYEVYAAENGQNGLGVFRQAHPELARVDIEMPGMNGIELLRRVIEETPADFLKRGV